MYAIRSVIIESMKFWRLALIAIFSLLSFLVVTPLRGHEYGGFKTSSVAGFIVFFAVTIFCLRLNGQKTSPWYVLIAILLGRWILELPMRAIHFEHSLISLPDSLMHTVGIVAGFLFWRLKGVSLKMLPLILGCLLSAWLSFYGYDLWLHKLNHGTFTGVISPVNIPANFEAVDEKQKIITGSDLSGKTVLLDFWYTGCGVCFLKFPRLQAAYEKYRDDVTVSIYALNKPVEEDAPGDAFRVIKENGYSFPVIIATDTDLPTAFGVTGYPTTIVISNNQTIFRGDIEGAVETIDKLRRTP